MSTSNQTLTCAGDSSIYHGGTYSGSPASYSGMNLDDGNTSYLVMTNTDGARTWSMSSFSGRDSINSVTINLKVNTDPGTYVRIKFYRGGSALTGDLYIYYSANYQTISSVLATNPLTSSAWKKEDLNGYEFGFAILSYDNPSHFFATYFDIVVNYNNVTNNEKTLASFIKLPALEKRSKWDWEELNKKPLDSMRVTKKKTAHYNRESRFWRSRW